MRDAVSSLTTGVRRRPRQRHPGRRWLGRLSVPNSRPALSSSSRQPLGDDRLRRGVDQVVEQGAIA
jgi:hypothetical protein